LADDCPFQYCAGFECVGDECFAAPQQARRAGKRACLYFRLFGGNGAGVIRGEFEIWFPARLRDDWLGGGGDYFGRQRRAGVKYWRRRHSRHSFHQSAILGFVCPRHGGGDCHSLCADLAGWAEEIERGGERQRARACGCRAARRLACGGGVYRADFLPVFLSVQDES